jgi:ligand-binding sensor domain-containing protein
MIWMGTMKGLDKLDRVRRQFTRYLSDPDDPDSLRNSTVWSIAEDQNGFLWIGTEGGLNRFDRETGPLFTTKTSPIIPRVWLATR